jgi:hypothetical protein
MKRYKVTLVGESPLLMHKDNIQFGEKSTAWSRDPRNKGASVAGDDRTPAWSWIGYCYHDGVNLCLDADNLMTMLRDGGKRCPAAKGKGSMKSQTQSGLLINEIGWPLMVGGAVVPFAPIAALEKESEFAKHEDMAKSMGFELFAKRAKIGTRKHVRVRPRFDKWSASGTITVLDASITSAVLDQILTHAGFFCGICDWRPSSPMAPGQFGRFTHTMEEIKD